jgi:DNA-binding Lrp family transcriptional regulator
MDETTTEDRRRNEHGQYDDRIPPEAVLEAFAAREDRARPLTANEIMEALDCSRRTAHNKLNELVNQGTLETRKVGARSRVWWVPIEYESQSQTIEQSSFSNDNQHVNPPDDSSMLETHHEAHLAAYEYLREHPEAKKEDFLRDVYNEHPAGYDSAEGWWDDIQSALKKLPGVDLTKKRRHMWRYLSGD